MGSCHQGGTFGEGQGWPPVGLFYRQPVRTTPPALRIPEESYYPAVPRFRSNRVPLARRQPVRRRLYYSDGTSTKQGAPNNEQDPTLATCYHPPGQSAAR